MHRVVASLALVAHMVFVAFTIIGGFLAWFLPWVLLPHVASAIWGFRMARTKEGRCPLSRAENWGREGSGRESLHERGFIAHYFEGRVYPVSWSRRVPVIVGTLILGSWLGLSVR